jgi:transposase-like protein
MGQKSGPTKEPAEQLVKQIRRATRRQFTAEEKIRIVLSGLRGEDSIAELCRREGIVQNLYYRWSKEFLEAGKKRLAGDTARFRRSLPGGTSPCQPLHTTFPLDHLDPPHAATAHAVLRISTAPQPWLLPSDTISGSGRRSPGSVGERICVD